MADVTIRKPTSRMLIKTNSMVSESLEEQEEETKKKKKSGMMDKLMPSKDIMKGAKK